MINEKQIDFVRIQKKILEWGIDNYRSYPWRETDNPYHVLLAEMMLHRTKSNQVADIYDDFIKKYPDPKAIAHTSLKELEKDLITLGLSWRVEKIKQCMDIIYNSHSGVVPDTYNDLIQLPGVGNYIAGAVMCIAYKIKTPLLDANIVRVLGRLFGLEIKESSRRSRNYFNLIEMLIPEENPDKFLFSILDFANKVCINKKQKCDECVLNNYCNYHLTNFI